MPTVKRKMLNWKIANRKRGIKMNVLRIDLIREIENAKEYKITYEETDVIDVILVGRTFNYDSDPEEILPESVISFAEKWILGDL